VPESQERLNTILEAARTNDAAHVEVFALDALARLAAQQGDIDKARALCDRADRRMEAASHFITDRDRTDADTVRQHPSPLSQQSPPPSEGTHMPNRPTRLADAEQSR
jgi:hypothetical protein